MLNLYIVRHGETEWNVADRIQGRLDSSLTEKGRDYAKLLSERLRETDFMQIIASPSQRTMETAQLIKGSRNIPIKQDERIMEMEMGPWQGLTKGEIRNQYPREYECFRNRPDIYQNTGAESFADMQKRAEEFLAEMKNGLLSGNVLVVTHGLLIKSLFIIFKGIELKDISMEPTVEGTSLTIVKIDRDQTEFMLEGDMSHVTGKGTVLRS